MEEGGALSIKVDQTTPAWTGDLTADSLSGPFATITVTDSGCGVAEEQLAQIFEMYFTSKSNGTGLGLPIAQQIVEKHGGKIEVVSAIDEGATFTVWLPLEAMKGATETEKQQSEFYREPAKRIN